MRPAFSKIVEARGAASSARPSARLPDMLGLDGDAARKLAELVLVLIGVGSVNANLALMAARIGIGHLYLIDPGLIKPESILTHPVQPADVGRSKVEVFGEQVKQINPSGRVFCFHGPVEQLDLFQLRQADLLVAAPDTLTCIEATGRIAQHLDKTLLQGAVYGPGLTATVRVFTRVCPRCLFTARDETEFGAEKVFSCTGDPSLHGRPTVSPAALCSCVASQMLLSVLRVVLGQEPALTDRVLEYHALTHRAICTPIARRPDCPTDHIPWTLLELPEDLALWTPATLLDRAGLSGVALEQVSLEVSDQSFQRRGACFCGRSHDSDRLRPRPGRGPGCPACCLEQIPGELLRPHLAEPFGSLLSAPVDSMRLRCQGRTYLFGRTETPLEIAR